jgi:hypothetical protein
MTELLARSTRALLAVTIALAPAVGLLALVHDVLPAHPGSVVSGAIGAISLAASIMLLGRPLAQRVAIELGLRRTVAIGLGVASAVSYHALAPMRLLTSGSGVVEQLAWILGEEGQRADRRGRTRGHHPGPCRFGTLAAVRDRVHGPADGAAAADALTRCR